MRLEIHSALANCVWLSPVCWRAAATSFGSTLVTRAALPVFISRTDWSSLSPSSSPVIVCSVCGLAIFKSLTNSFEKVAGDVAGDGLGVNHQEPDFAEWKLGEIDHSYPVAFTHAGSRPTHFPKRTAAGDDFSCFRVSGDPGAEGGALFFGPELARFFDEAWGFCNGIRWSMLRH